MKYAILVMCFMGLAGGSGGADPEVIIDVNPPYVTVPSNFGWIDLNRYSSYHTLDLLEYPNQTLKIQNGTSFIKIQTRITESTRFDSQIQDVRKFRYAEWLLKEISVNNQENSEKLGKAIKTFCDVFALDKTIMVQRIIDLQKKEKFDLDLIIPVIKQIVPHIDIQDIKPDTVKEFLKSNKSNPVLCIFNQFGYHMYLFVKAYFYGLEVISGNDTDSGQTKNPKEFAKFLRNILDNDDYFDDKKSARNCLLELSTALQKEKQLEQVGLELQKVALELRHLNPGMSNLANIRAFGAKRLHT